jgi:thiamine biosynthesis lipoprotein
MDRRRTLAILGAFAGMPLFAGDCRRPASAALHQWEGTSLGSPSRLLLYHPDRVAAERVVALCAAEIERLERIFALYRDDSEVVRLNRDGRIANPSHDLLVVLSACSRLSALSQGAFDVTVQPLWDVYARHFFGAAGAALDGPDPRAVAAALALVNWRDIEFDGREVALRRPGMGVTLNGIAQGYVCDRITGILRDCGFDRVLADLGRSEISVIGRHPDDRAWRVGLADPRRPETFAVVLDLMQGSLCTSGGYGTRFEASGRFHHLFDTATGASSGHYIAVSVFAASAMVADALSTAIYVTPPERGRAVLAEYRGVTALATLPDGAVQQLGGGARFARLADGSDLSTGSRRQ